MREVDHLANKHMLEGQALHTMDGATQNPPPASASASPGLSFGNPACIQLSDVEQVEAWVASSKARPLRAQVVLHTVSRAADTGWW